MILLTDNDMYTLFKRILKYYVFLQCIITFASVLVHDKPIDFTATFKIHNILNPFLN